MTEENAEQSWLCPICGKALAGYKKGDPVPQYFPFCSQRCKQVDLGRWFGERYVFTSDLNEGDEGEGVPSTEEQREGDSRPK